MEIKIKFKNILYDEETTFDKVDDALDYLLSMTDRTEHILVDK